MTQDYIAELTIDRDGKTIEFNDGLTFYVRAGTMEERAIQFTVDRDEGLTIDGREPVTTAYPFRDFVDPETGEHLEDVPPEGEKPVTVIVPTRLESTDETDLVLYTAPEEYPKPDNWTPDEGIEIDPVAPGRLMFELEGFQTFQINMA